MHKMKYRFLVDMAADDLFALTQDYSKRQQWDSLLKTAEFLTPLPIAKGTQLRYTTHYGSSMTVEYMTYNPPKAASIKMIGKHLWLAEFAGGWHFKAVSTTQTQVTFAYHVKANYLPKLLTPLFINIFALENRRRAGKLKLFAESTLNVNKSKTRNHPMSSTDSTSNNSHLHNSDSDNGHADNSQSHNSKSKPIIMYYDDACVICSSEASSMQARNPTGIQLTPVDAGLEVLNAAGFSREDAMTYLCVQDSDGNWVTHMEAVRTLYKTAGVPWANLLYLPIVKQLGDGVYPFVARNRYRFPDWLSKLLYGKEVVAACQDGVCKVPATKRAPAAKT